MQDSKAGTLNEVRADTTAGHSRPTRRANGEPSASVVRSVSSRPVLSGDIPLQTRI